MSDDDYIGIADILPGMHVEITGRPWVGTVTSSVLPGGRFTAIRDGQDDGTVTSWAVDNVGSIRLLPSEPLPTEPGSWFFGKPTALDYPAERWFVVLDVDADGKPDPARITYISQSYREWSPGQAARHGLVRLPDPEVTR